MISLKHSFHVTGNRLFILGKEFENYKIYGKLGTGANGVVYHALNMLLNREEAVKVWHAKKPQNSQKQFKKGLLEAQKLALVSPKYAVMIYSAQKINDGINNVFLATMEYIDGKTLEWHCENSNQFLRCQLAQVYLNAIVKTTTEATRHGDAHLKNVLVYEIATKYEKHLRIKLCDFGTSFYSGKEASEKRHWRIVRETIILLTKDLPHADFCLSVLDRDWPKGIQMASDAYEARKKGIDFSESDIANFWAAPLRDYTRDLFDLNYQTPASTAVNQPMAGTSFQ